MKKALFAVALLSFIPSMASADVITTNCSRSIYGTTCRTVVSDGDATGFRAKVIHVPETQPRSLAELEEAARKEREWTAYCKPEKHIDSLGVTRLTYAHEGCGFGKVQ